MLSRQGSSFYDSGYPAPSSPLLCCTCQKPSGLVDSLCACWDVAVSSVRGKCAPAVRALHHVLAQSTHAFFFGSYVRSSVACNSPQHMSGFSEDYALYALIACHLVCFCHKSSLSKAAAPAAMCCPHSHTQLRALRLPSARNRLHCFGGRCQSRLHLQCCLPVPATPFSINQV